MDLVDDLRLSIFENSVDVGIDMAELYLDNIIDKHYIFLHKFFTHCLVLLKST